MWGTMAAVAGLVEDPFDPCHMNTCRSAIVVPDQAGLDTGVVSVVAV